MGQNEKMRVLITGGAGYIGSHLAVVLSKANHDVIIFDNFSNSSKDVLDSLEEIIQKVPVCVDGDIRDPGILKHTFETHKVDAVIHCAGLKAVGESVSNPIAYYENNVSGTLNLIDVMTRSSVRKLVFSSSATVYGEPQYLPIDELHPISPTNPYGNTKAMIETIFKDLAISDPNWSILCLRYFNPVGAHSSGLIGEKPNGTPNNLMPYIAQVASGELEELSVYGNDYPTADGSGVRDFIHVMDLAEGHLAALIYLQAFTGWDAINLGTGEGYSVLQMLNAFELASNKTIRFRIDSRRPGDIAKCYADIRKASEKIGWHARFSIDEMCQSTWKWTVSHHSKR